MVRTNGVQAPSFARPEMSKRGFRTSPRHDAGTPFVREPESLLCPPAGANEFGVTFMTRRVPLRPGRETAPDGEGRGTRLGPPAPPSTDLLQPCADPCYRLCCPTS